MDFSLFCLLCQSLLTLPSHVPLAKAWDQKVTPFSHSWRSCSKWKVCWASAAQLRGQHKAALRAGACSSLAESSEKEYAILKRSYWNKTPPDFCVVREQKFWVLEDSPSSLPPSRLQIPILQQGSPHFFYRVGWSILSWSHSQKKWDS